MLRRIMSMLLCVVIVISMVPAQVFATDDVEEEISEQILEVEETTVPTKGDAMPTEEHLEPTEETAETTETIADPTEEVTAPMDTVTESTEETTAPTEAVTEHTEETTAPVESKPIVEISVETSIEVSNATASGTEVKSTIVASGSCGENADWTLDEEGTLIISGTGGMFSNLGTLPWADHADSIRTLIVEDGVTSLAPISFDEYTCLTDVTIADSVSELYWGLFSRCYGLKNVRLPSSITDIPQFTFYACTSLEEIQIPDNVTIIGASAFHSCSSLRSIQLPKGLQAIGSSALCRCTSLSSIALPEGMQVINTEAFLGCTNLRNLTIPKSVTYVDRYVFDLCYDLQVFFQGDAPWIDSDAFGGARNLTAYYPDNNSTWAGVITSIKRDVTWKPIDRSSYRHNTLAELTELDYLAFSQVSYLDFAMDETVRECLMRTPGNGTNKWFDVWGEEDITYAQLCEGIADWEVCYILENNDNGFYAVSFRNGSGEAVLAYRGSKPLENLLLQITDLQTLLDWVDNDLAMILYNVDGKHNQYDDAITSYKDTAKVEGIHTVVATGHSLGGLWADIASAFSGCQGISFNAISALDIMYAQHPIQLGRAFRGIDVWNFVDHANRFDILAGVTEGVASSLYIAAKIKPYIKHYSNYGDGAIFKSHGLKSIVSRAGEGLVLNGSPGSWQGTSGISHTMRKTNRAIDIGSSGYDYFDKGLSVKHSRSAFGGDGTDIMITSIWNDTLVGGRGSDTLDGGWGDDIYYYFKGDGLDTIIDAGGNDRLYLKDFDESDLIEVYDDPTSDYINILCNGKTIIQVFKKNREYSIFSRNTFKLYINNGPVNNITNLFSKYKSGLHTVIRCPVSIEILSPTGNVVYILQNDAVGAHYTDYGNFYVFQEESGGYGKVLDLAEGYSFRIVGEDQGTMDISYRNVSQGTLSSVENTVTAVPVSSNFTATVAQSVDGNMILSTDTDGDGVVDQEMTFDTDWTETNKNRLLIEPDIAEEYDSVWIDGREYQIQTEDNASYVDLPDSNAKIMIAYTYHADDDSDVHTQYPTGMKVWTLSNTDGLYSAVRVDELDDILQYAGTSIRVTGNQGIRMITSIDEANKAALIGNGLAGYTVKEYGTAVAWTSQLSNTKPLVLGKSYVSSNYAYKKDVADPIFAYVNGRIQYTNVLVGFSLDQCKNDLAMRPYMILEDTEGNEITLYGGIVERSIGYIASEIQKKNLYETGSAEYTYLQNIIDAFSETN